MFGGAGFGAVGFGTALAPRTFTIDSDVLPQDGGVLVTFSSGLDNGVYRAHFGPLGTIDDPLCYGGTSGAGPNISVANNGCTLWVPPAPLGAAGWLFIKVSGVGAATIATGNVVTIVGFPFRESVLSLRTSLVSRLRTGYRAPDDIGLQV